MKPTKRVERESWGQSTYYDFCGFTFYQKPVLKNSSLVFRPRLKVFTFPDDYRVSWDPETETATSYGWWPFVKRINGKLVFNAGKYSVTTSAHQRAVAFHLACLGKRIDLVVHSRLHLNNPDFGPDALEYALNNDDLETAVKIAKVFKIKLTQAMVDQNALDREEKLALQFMERSVQRQEKKFQSIVNRLLGHESALDSMKQNNETMEVAS